MGGAPSGVCSLIVCFLAKLSESVCDRVEMQFKILLMLSYQCGKDNSGKKTDDSGYNDKSDHDQTWNLGHYTIFQIFGKDRNKEDHCKQDKNSSYAGKKLQWFVITKHLDDRLENFESIGVCVQLGFTAFRTVTVINDYVVHLHVLIDRVDRHFCLNLKIL